MGQPPLLRTSHFLEAIWECPRMVARDHDTSHSSGCPDDRTATVSHRRRTTGPDISTHDHRTDHSWGVTASNQRRYEIYRCVVTTEISRRTGFGRNLLPDILLDRKPKIRTAREGQNRLSCRLRCRSALGNFRGFPRFSAPRFGRRSSPVSSSL